MSKQKLELTWIGKENRPKLEPRTFLEDPEKKRCCDVVDAHDPPSAKNSPVPTARQLGKDIADLKSVVGAIKARRKQGAVPEVARI